MRSSLAEAQMSRSGVRTIRRTEVATLAAVVRSSVEQNSSTRIVHALLNSSAFSKACAIESRAFCPSDNRPAGVTSGCASARPQALSRRRRDSTEDRSISIVGLRARSGMGVATTLSWMTRCSSCIRSDLPEPLGPVMNAISPVVSRWWISVALVAAAA